MKSSKEVSDKALEAVRMAKQNGSVRKGINEVTKALERSQAKLVVYAADVSPKEIIMHIPLLSKDQNVPCVEVRTKSDLGKAVGMDVGASAIAVIDAGEETHSLEDMISKIKQV